MRLRNKQKKKFSLSKTVTKAKKTLISELNKIKVNKKEFKYLSIYLSVSSLTRVYQLQRTIKKIVKLEEGRTTYNESTAKARKHRSFADHSDVVVTCRNNMCVYSSISNTCHKEYNVVEGELVEEGMMLFSLNDFINDTASVLNKVKQNFETRSINDTLRFSNSIGNLRQSVAMMTYNLDNTIKLLGDRRKEIVDVGIHHQNLIAFKYPEEKEKVVQDLLFKTSMLQSYDRKITRLTEELFCKVKELSVTSRKLYEHIQTEFSSKSVDMIHSSVTLPTPSVVTTPLSSTQ